VRVSLPPLAEQRRIVARIEALFGVIRDARKDLDRTLVLAERFRKRVLASAFENTDGWPVQPLGSVIARIEAGKNIRCVERQPHAGERGIVKISAVTWGTFDAREIKTAPVTADLNPATRIRNGDFLISRANTLELVGAPVIAEGVPPETYLSDKVLRLTFAEDIAEWVLWYLRSPQGRQEIESRSSGNQLSMRNIGQAALKEIPLPLPQSAERRRILAGVKASHAESHAAGHDARRGLALLEHLERAILDAAFRGDLVPQDAADEPVEETLARLRQEAEAPADPRGRQRRRAA
jgi:type I restriction enzyme S subunit